MPVGPENVKTKHQQNLHPGHSPAPLEAKALGPYWAHSLINAAWSNCLEIR
jgi:hypothetical protein